MSKTTIVSAFITNINQRSDISIRDYWKLGKLLLQTTTPKIIFLDEIMYQYARENMQDSWEWDDFTGKHTNTRIYKIQFHDSYLYTYQDYITSLPSTDNPYKDTMQFMMVMCNKTEWIREAILKNDFHTPNFIWVDFGIRHVFQCSDPEFVQILDKIQYKEYSDIRIPSIWTVEYMQQQEWRIYQTVCWFFAGGVFGGDADKLFLFADKMKSKCIEIIKEKNMILWEVNIWYLIYKEAPELFFLYTADHNDTLLKYY